MQHLPDRPNAGVARRGIGRIKLNAAASATAIARVRSLSNDAFCFTITGAARPTLSITMPKSVNATLHLMKMVTFSTPIGVAYCSCASGGSGGHHAYKLQNLPARAKHASTVRGARAQTISSHPVAV